MRFKSLAITALFIGTAVLFSSAASAQWTTAYYPPDLFYNGGRVAIGTSTATQKLTVGGNVEIADVPAGGPELSTNGVDWTGNGSIANNWATWYWNGMGGSITFTNYVRSTPSNGFSGNYQRVEFTSVTGQTGGKLYQNLTFQQNHLYRISFKYRSSTTLQVTLGDNEGGGILLANTGNAIAVTMLTGPTIQNRPTLDFYSPGGGLTPTAGTWFEVDDVSVKDATTGGDLIVHGNTTVTGNIVASGNITGAKVINAVYQDVAEWVPATTKMTPGTVVVLNRDRDNEVMPSTRAYDTAVAGVISENPGVVLGVPSDSKAQVATTGRVKVHVDATKGPIAVGDLLVTGDKPGTAMKSQPIDLGGVAIHRPGTVIGKALQPLPAGEGEILVLLSLQ